MTEMLFWGEEFDLNNLPDIALITVQLWREADPKKKKDKNQLIACVRIPVQDVDRRSEVELWYPAAPPAPPTLNTPTTPTAPLPPNVSTTNALSQFPNNAPLLRIKARYQSVVILPLWCYTRLLDAVTEHSVAIVTSLESWLAVKAKEDLTQTLVSVHQKKGSAINFLADLVMLEMNKLDDNNMVLRGNSMATKSMECYLKLVGEQYLHDTLYGVVQSIMHGEDDCEVDPLKVSNSSQLARNQDNIMMLVDMVWAKIITSAYYFPHELREVFTEIRSRMEGTPVPGGRPMSCYLPPDTEMHNLCDHVISACLFLRFLCPAILAPSLFGLSQEFPEEARVIRTFTLVAKSIQTLANFTPFGGGKESYMGFMNRFVETQLETMGRFLRHISHSPDSMPTSLLSSSVQEGASGLSFDLAERGSYPALAASSLPMAPVGGHVPQIPADYHIDLAYCLAVIHWQLIEALDRIPLEKQPPCLSQLRPILSEIDDRLVGKDLSPPPSFPPVSLHSTSVTATTASSTLPPTTTVVSQQPISIEYRSTSNSSTFSHVNQQQQPINNECRPTLSNSTSSSSSLLVLSASSSHHDLPGPQSCTAATTQTHTQQQQFYLQPSVTAQLTAVPGAQIDAEWREMVRGVNLLTHNGSSNSGSSSSNSTCNHHHQSQGGSGPPHSLFLPLPLPPQSASTGSTCNSQTGTVESSGYHSPASPCPPAPPSSSTPLYYNNPVYEYFTPLPPVASHGYHDNATVAPSYHPLYFPPSNSQLKQKRPSQLTSTNTNYHNLPSQVQQQYSAFSEPASTSSGDKTKPPDVTNRLNEKEYELAVARLRRDLAVVHSRLAAAQSQMIVNELERTRLLREWYARMVEQTNAATPQYAQPTQIGDELQQQQIRQEEEHQLRLRINAELSTAIALTTAIADSDVANDDQSAISRIDHLVQTNRRLQQYLTAFQSTAQSLSNANDSSNGSGHFAATPELTELL